MHWGKSARARTFALELRGKFGGTQIAVSQPRGARDGRVALIPTSEKRQLPTPVSSAETIALCFPNNASGVEWRRSFAARHVFGYVVFGGMILISLA